VSQTEAAAGLEVGEGLLEVVGDFIAELRFAGVPVSTTEALDAVASLTLIPLAERATVRQCLAATLVKRSGHLPTFHRLFDVYFSIRPAGLVLPDLDDPADGRAGADSGGTGEAAPAMTAAELAEALMQALREGDQAAIERLARAAVARYGGVEPGRAVGGSYYVHRTLRQLDLDGALLQLLAQPDGTPDDGGSPLEQRLRAEEYRRRIDALKEAVEAEVRRLLVADRGAGAVAKTIRRPLPEDIDFMHASREEVAALRRAAEPLTRKLAARLARRRRHLRRGPLDFRATVRRSLASGGVPLEPRFKPPRPSKPDLMLVADISGSVAAFARFTLQFIYAMSSQFGRVRSFAFIDGVDEVTSYLQGADDIAEAVHRINTEANVISGDGHSDYGHALESFWEQWGREVTHRTTVLLLGDARNNYHAAQAWVVAELAKRARHVYWLNPEPRSYWDTGDSILGSYAAHCSGVWECRNLAQLERFVDHLG
jgi:uncharacterized protein with von Willebrand factor type A (vWA) domain